MESKRIYSEYREIVETLLKKNNIHEGIWSVFIEFKTAAINARLENEILPSFITGVRAVGIFQVEQESNIAFDAAKLNPAPTSKKKTKAK